MSKTFSRPFLEILSVSCGVRDLLVTVANFCYLVCVCSWWLSHVPLFVTLETAGDQTPLSMGFFRQEYWSRLPFPIPGDLPNPGIKPMSLGSPALAGGVFTKVGP